MMRLRLPAPILALTLLAGCISAPDLSRAPEPQALAAPYPELAPLGPLIAEGEGGTLDEPSIAAIQAEGAALEARGAAQRNRPIN